MRKKKVLFYSSVASKRQFSTQRFYRTDITLLRDLGYSVSLSNSWIDFLIFWRYDIAFIYFYRFGVIPALLARLAGRVVIFTGGIDYLDRDYAGNRAFFIQSIFFNLCGLLSHANVIVSDADFENCKRIPLLFSRSKNRVIKHCIDVDRYACADTANRTKAIITIAWMARIENVVRKGVLETIRLFRQIHERDPDFRLFIIGPTGEGTVAVNALISQLGLEGRVLITGAISEEDKIARLKSAVAYTQLSKYEGFGIAAIEALAAGAIVIHSNAGGLKEAVGSHGIVWSDGDSSCVDCLFDQIDAPLSHAARAAEGLGYVKGHYAREVRLAGFRSILAGFDKL
jgi:glycosyltransferase involved in cell wall biosynthesis